MLMSSVVQDPVPGLSVFSVSLSLHTLLSFPESRMRLLLEFNSTSPFRSATTLTLHPPSQVPTPHQISL